MLNSKYSKVLTAILIIAILVIIGLLIFVGIDLYKAYKTDADADGFDSQFNGFIENAAISDNMLDDPNISVDNNSQATTNVIGDPNISVVEVQEVNNLHIKDIKY